MSKIIEAVLEGGEVKVGNLSIPDAVVLSEGEASSQGLLIIEEGNVFYIAKTTPDSVTIIENLMDSLEDVASALNKIATTLTSIGAGMTGPTTAPPPTLAADVAIIVSKASEITATRTALNTLKGALR